jgi:hypothetical protein
MAPYFEWGSRCALVCSMMHVHVTLDHTHAKHRITIGVRVLGVVGCHVVVRIPA